MVKITNGQRTFEVSAGAYESVYKGLGFHKVGVIVDEPEHEEEKVPPKQQETGSEEHEEDDAPDEPETEGEPGSGLDLDALLEKPLSQWEPDELKEFVRAKGIDTAGAKKVSQVRGIVKKYLEDQAKSEA